MTVLVTGGAGFIGSHTCVELLNAGYEVIVVDNLSNSKPEAIDRIQQITGKRPQFYQMDILDRRGLQGVFDHGRIDAVIHFAGYKAVGESVEKPLEYYWNNITGTLTLLDAMKVGGCKKLSFRLPLRFTEWTTLFRLRKSIKPLRRILMDTPK